MSTPEDTSATTPAEDEPLANPSRTVREDVARQSRDILAPESDVEISTSQSDAAEDEQETARDSYLRAKGAL